MQEKFEMVAALKRQVSEYTIVVKLLRRIGGGLYVTTNYYRATQEGALAPCRGIKHGVASEVYKAASELVSRIVETQPVKAKKTDKITAMLDTIPEG